MNEQPRVIPSGGATVLILVEGGEPEGHATGELGWSGYLRFWGGAVQRLRTMGFDVVIGTLRGSGPLQAAARGGGWRTFHLGATSIQTYPLAVLRLRSIIRRERVDLVHGNESIQGAVAGAAARLAGIPALFHRHHTVARGPRAQLTQLASRFSDLTLCVSNAVASSARSEGLAEGKIVVAHNGIPPFPVVERAKIHATRAELGLPPGMPVVVVVGHLRPEKGHATLLRAAELAAQRMEREIAVVVVGDGPLRRQLQDHAAQLEGVRTSFAGHQADVHRFLATADVSAVPSYSEAFGLVAIEAMACNKAVIVSDVDGLREIVDDETTGILVRPRDHESLADALMWCLTDRMLAAKWGAAGGARYREYFTLDAMVERWADVYKQILDSRR